jgi:copper homeostasis protein
MARERVDLPIYVLIRPRAGDFVYSDLEFETMERDIRNCAALGCDGVVIGALDAEGHVDVPRCRALIAAAGTLGVTFHRAFDVSRDPRRALEDIVALRCERVLSSGARDSALAGAALLRELVVQAGGRITVMPGASIDDTNIATIRTLTGAREFHASAKRQMPSRRNQDSRSGLGMDGGEWRTDASQVRALIAALQSRDAL